MSQANIFKNPYREQIWIFCLLFSLKFYSLICTLIWQWASKKCSTLPLKLDKPGGGASLIFSSLCLQPVTEGVQHQNQSKSLTREFFEEIKRGKGCRLKSRKHYVWLNLKEAYFDRKLDVRRHKIWDSAASLSNIEKSWYDRNFLW